MIFRVCGEIFRLTEWVEPHGTTFHEAFSAGFCSTFAHPSFRCSPTISELCGEDFQTQKKGPSAPLCESNSSKEGNRVIRSGLALSAGTVLPTSSPSSLRLSSKSFEQRKQHRDHHNYLKWYYFQYFIRLWCYLTASIYFSQLYDTQTRARVGGKLKYLFGDLLTCSKCSLLQNCLFGFDRWGWLELQDCGAYVMQILQLFCSARANLFKHSAPNCVTAAVRGADPGSPAEGQDLCR